MQHILTAAILICLPLSIAVGEARAQAPKISDAPKPVQELATAIQGKDSSAMRKEIVRIFGKPARDVGSGFHIEQWDVAGGVLTLHQAIGPTFRDAKDGKIFRLLPTNNPVGKNLLTSYEMYSRPDAAQKGRSWLGNLTLGPRMQYRFEESALAQDARDAREGNFFFRHPCGHLEVRYAEGINAETPLEALAEGSVIARLIFRSGPIAGRAEFVIKSSEQGRRLSFGADKPLPFEMEATWRDFGQQADGKAGTTREDNAGKK